MPISRATLRRPSALIAGVVAAGLVAIGLTALPAAVRTAMHERIFDPKNGGCDRFVAGHAWHFQPTIVALCRQ